MVVLNHQTQTRTHEIYATMIAQLEGDFARGGQTRDEQALPGIIEKLLIDLPDKIQSMTNFPHIRVTF
jgi:hypothetical protein